ncbi:MAG: hypothetical protein WKF97_20730 [Chitinophagaceae bacterium]
MTSPLDAWSILAPFLTHSDLESFKRVFLNVLAELNPALELDIDQRYLASVYGKIPKFSNALKEGLIESLILIAVYGESFKVTSLTPSQLFADSIVRELLENAEGSKWCSLSTVLPLLAEASPGSFLLAVEKSLKESNPSVLEMFGQDGDILFSSSSYYTGLLWALESLAWSKEYLWRVTMILGALARLDPGGNLRNRPINSLKEIHIAWHREIDADFHTRKTVLEKLMQKEPDVAWHLFLKLLSENHPVPHPIHTCRWRFSTQLRGRTFRQHQVWDYCSFVFDKLIFLASGNEERVASLIVFYPRLLHEDSDKLLKFLLESKDLTNHPKDAVWNELRSLLGWHREHSEQDWALSEDELKKIEIVFTVYTPNNDLKRFLFLFKENWPAFPQGLERRKMKEANEFINEQRRAALDCIYKKKGLSGILEMAEDLENLGFPGHSMSELDFSNEEEMMILRGLTNGSNNKINMLCRYYLFARSIKLKESFVNKTWEMILSMQPDDNVQSAFFLSLEPQKFIWALLESLPPAVGNEYWLKVNLSLDRFSTDHRLYAIYKLLEVNRHVIIINQVSHFAEELPTELLINLLYEAATVKVVEEGQLIIYSLSRIFEELQNRKDTNEDRLAQLEWCYIDFLTDVHSEGVPATLFNKLSKDPQFFIDMVLLVNKPYEGTSDELNEEKKDERYKKVDSAKRLLESLRMIPGVDRDGTINEEVLNHWVTTVRAQAIEINCLDGVDSQIGVLMAWYPRNNTYWPAKEICEVIDHCESAVMMSDFRTEIYNSRSVHVKGAYEGGGQERSLSAYFEKMGKLLVPRLSTNRVSFNQTGK